MPANKPLVLVVLGVLTVLGIGGALSIWPNYHEVATTAARISELQYKAANSEEQTTAVKGLTDEVERERAFIRKELKFVPESADVAGLIGVLSVPVDGRTVQDRQFTRGKPVEAAPGGQSGAQAMPLTVEMKATFPAVFRLLQMVESMKRLVRVSSVRLSSEKAADAQEESVITALIGLEAIYDESQSVSTAPAPRPGGDR